MRNFIIRHAVTLSTVGTITVVVGTFVLIALTS